MHNAILKTSFWLATLVLTFVFLVPAQLLLETVLPRGDRMLVGTVVVCLCLLSAGRVTSFLFRAVRITDERLSIFGSRRAGRSG
jgi:hypothetical protein